jgi:hypothetical protein
VDSCAQDVFADLIAAVADGAACADGASQLWGDREHAFGVVWLGDHVVAVG